MTDEISAGGQNGAVTVFADDAQGEAALASYAAEIRTLHAQAWANLCRIGKLLTQAKTRIAHGAWGEWLETQCRFDQTTANRFMRVYRELGDDTRFDGLDRSALYILAGAPEADRERLLEAAREGASTRELNAEAARLKEERRAAQAQCAQLEDALRDARAREEQAQGRAEAMRQQCADAKTLCDELRTQLDRVERETEQKAAERIAALEENLVDAGEEMKRLRMNLAMARRAEAEPRIVEKNVEVYPNDYDAAKARAAELEAEAARTERELSAAKAALAQAEQALEEAKRAPAGVEAIRKKPRELKNMSADAFAREAGRMLAACAAVPYMGNAFDFMPEDMRARYEDVLAQLEAFCEGARRALDGYDETDGRDAG